VTRVEFEGGSGRLVGLWAQPAGVPSFAALMSHPHPLFGGTMDNKVTYRVARALEEAGGSVLRYNFRGAGESEGAHDHGLGEQEDLRAALSFLRARAGEGLPMLLAGFSFGAAMSSRVGASDARISGLLLVGAPLGTYPFDELSACEKPVAFVHGEHDEHGPLASVRALVASLRCPARLVVVPGAGHFFDGEQVDLREAVREILASGHFGPAFVPRSSGERSC
jgi:alpha/beta superfamily hydrolase